MENRADVRDTNVRQGCENKSECLLSSVRSPMLSSDSDTWYGIPSGTLEDVAAGSIMARENG